MTTAGTEAVFAAAKPIGDNVWNFFQDFQQYKEDFTDEKGNFLTRDEVKEKFKGNINFKRKIEKYDEIADCMTWVDISDMFMSTQSLYNCRRYDFTHAKVESDNLVILDKDNGDLIYLACDQINGIIRFDGKQKGYAIDEETGKSKEIDYNKDRIRVNTIYKG